MNIQEQPRLTAAAIAFAVLSAGSPVMAQQSARTELTLCNKTGQNVEIALAYMDAVTGRWTLSAWHKRKPGECKAFGTVKTGLFYYHAKNERGGVWPNDANTDRRYCVPSTAIKREMVSQCGRGEPNRPFRGRMLETAKFTFSFS